MIEIPLSGRIGAGRVALVDDDDAWVLRHPWRMSANGYVVSNGRLYLHRLILDTPAGRDTDHANGDRLDNRRANLRIATRSQNNANGGRHRNSRQPYRGVRLHFGKWQARIRHLGREITLGTYVTAEEASDAYRRAAREIYGEFAR